MPRLEPVSLQIFARETLLLSKSLRAAEEIQWQRSHTPKPREDTTERASGGHGDPTADTVADERRLTLREKVITAQRVMTRATAAVTDQREKLDAAIAEWYGDPEREK